MLRSCAAERPGVRPATPADRAESFAAAVSECCAVQVMYGSSPNGRAAFLDTLSPEEHAAFTQLGTRRRYAVGDVLIHEGDHTQELVVLYEGLVKATARLDRDRVLLRDIWIAGDVVGETAAVGAGPRSATVTACSDVVAAIVPRHELEAFLLVHPELSLSFIQMVCGRLRRSDRLRLELGGYPVPVRLARVLVELAVTYGQPERNSLRIDVNLSQTEFAALTGARTRSVHKALAHLRDKDIITTGHRKTYVRDMTRLRRAARLSVPLT